MFDDITDLTLLTKVFYKKREKLAKNRMLRDYAVRFDTLQMEFNARRGVLLAAKV